MTTFTNNDVNSGDVVLASHHNEQGSRIATVLNGGIDNDNINASAAIAGSKLADGSVTPAKLETGTGSSWEWQSWSPTIVGFDSTANSTIIAKYIQIGKNIFWRFQITLAGGDNPNASEVTITPPVAFVSDYADGLPVGSGTLTDAGTDTYEAIALAISGVITLRTVPANTTYSRVSQGITANAPFTWANTDRMQFSGMYEAN